MIVGYLGVNNKLLLLWKTGSMSLKGAKMNSRVWNTRLKKQNTIVPEGGEPQKGSFYTINSPLLGTIGNVANYFVGPLPTAIHLCPF